MPDLEARVILSGENMPRLFMYSILYISPFFLGLLAVVGVVDEVTDPMKIETWAL